MKKLLLIFTLTLVFNQISNAQSARIQFIHNSPDALLTQLDVYVNGNLVLDNFDFRTATPFRDIPANTPLIVHMAPSSSTSINDAIFTTTITFTANETYIVVADGIASTTGYSPAQPFALNIFSPGRESAISSGNTDILVHHGSPDSASGDLVVVGLGGGTIANNLNYGDFSVYAELSTSDYVVDVRNASGSVLVESYSMSLAALNLNGQAIVALASGFYNPANNSSGPAFGMWLALSSGGNLIQLPVAPLSTSDSKINNFQLYPNPTSEFLNFKGLNSQNITIDIVDLQGRKLNSNSYKLTNENTLDVSKVASGIYHLILTDDQKNSKVRKFIKN